MKEDGSVENVDVEFLTRDELEVLADSFRDNNLEFRRNLNCVYRR